MRSIKIKEAEARQRLDLFISKQLPELSRSFIQRLLDDGRIKLNGLNQKAGYKLKLNDKLSFNFELNDLDKIEPIELPTLYEDKDVIVIDKPAGVISHSRGRYWNEPSVASFVRQKTGQKGERAGIVHRLDRATSGVMICAKNSKALHWLQKQFSDRKVRKTYLAIVKGQPSKQEAVIEMPIERHPARPQTFRVSEQGKPSSTTYEVIKHNTQYSFLNLTPLTGRTHQLRVHLAKIGFPIVGDVLYGGEQADRLMLHASSLEIDLPGGRSKTFRSTPPEEFSEYLD